MFERVRRRASQLAHAALRERLTPETPLDEAGRPDWVFVAPADSKGWILDAICREIGGRVRGDWRVAYYSKTLVLPPARNYFFAHFWNYMDMIRRQPELVQSPCLIWYTHPRKTPFSDDDLMAGLSQARRVVATCGLWRESLLAKGLAPAKVDVVLGAADPALYEAHRRGGSGAVGLSSSYYERKRPDLVRELVALLPKRQFVLLGRNWEQYEHFEALRGAPNFTYVTAPYAEYPAYYRKMDVFLSASTLEGGPIPLVEAMMCNIVPVASRTGFAPDLITHGRNGYLFDVDASAELVADLIERAYQVRADVAAGVRALSWRRFALRIISMGDNE